MPASERRRELKRRPHRREKLQVYRQRVEKPNASEKQVIASKLRALTPGAELVIHDLRLEERT